MEASRNGKLREKRRKDNINTDLLTHKMQTLENYNLYMQPLKWHYDEKSYQEIIGDIGKTGDSKTGEVRYSQVERAERLTYIAKETMKNSFKAKIRAKLAPLKNENIDYLEAKQAIISGGLEEIGLSEEDMGKTGDSSIGKVTEKHKTVSKRQIEDAKYTILQKRKLQNRE